MDITLDPGIRVWIFVPIGFITFLFGCAMNYVRILVASDQTATLAQIKDAQQLVRSTQIRRNAGFVCARAFHMRKDFFINEENGILTQGKARPAQQKNMMTDPSMASEMLKGQLLNMVPNIVVGYIINVLFSGFLIAKVPFPLTFRFKTMLQRGIDLPELDPSWVSSASWYFLCMFGLRRLFGLFLGSNNQADPSMFMEQQMTWQASQMASQDVSAKFKKEWEEFTVCRHRFMLENMDTNMAMRGKA